MAVYNIDENLTPVLLSTMHTLFYVSFAGLGIDLGLERVGLGLGHMTCKNRPRNDL